MNPLRYLAAAQALGVFALVFVVGLLAFFAWRWLKKGGLVDAGNTLKENTPLGVPAKAIDATISAVTGREETLGGWLAEIFDPATRKVNQSFEPVKSTAPLYYSDGFYGAP